MKRVILILLFIFSFSYGNEVVGSGNIFDIIKKLELKISVINTKKIELKKSGITDFSSDNTIVQMNKEKSILLEKILILFKTNKAYATLSIPYENTKSNLLANIDDNKKNGSGLSYIYRDKIILANLELNNDFSSIVNTLNSLLDSKVAKSVYQSYLEGLIKTLKDNNHKEIEKFVVKNKDKKIKKYTDVNLYYNNFILNKSTQIIIIEYLIENIDNLISLDVVLDKIDTSKNIDDRIVNSFFYFEFEFSIFDGNQILLTPGKILSSLLIFIAILFARYGIIWIVELFISYLKSKKDNLENKDVYLHKIISSAKMSISLFTLTLAFYFSVKVLYSPNELDEWLKIFFNLLHLISATIMIWNIVSNFQETVSKNIRKKKTEITKEAIDFSTVLIRGLIVLSFIFIIVYILIPGLVNYLAGTSVIIAFMLKDTGASLFDTFKIIIDKNINSGDWINLAEKNLEGVVHRIGIFNTTIIAFDQTSITIPSTTLVKSIVQNFSRRSTRQIKFSFFLSTEVSKEILNKIIKDVNVMLLNHPNLNKPGEIKGTSYDKRERGASDTLFAKYIGNKNGDEILVYSFTKEDDWMYQLDTRENMLLQIKDICENNGTKIVIKDSFLDTAKINSYKTIMMNTVKNKEN